VFGDGACYGRLQGNIYLKVIIDREDKMKKLISFMALVAFFTFTQMAMADYTIKINQGLYQTGNGGEFRIDPGTDGLPWASGFYSSKTKNVGFNPSFQSFCLEQNEYISYNTTYSAVLNTAAVAGGIGGNPDPLSWGTAYLYYNFAKGTLENYDYLTELGRKGSAAALQNAIWVLENELNMTPGEVAANIFLSSLIGSGQRYADLAAARGDNNLGSQYGAFVGVKVLNLYDGATLKQDQLVVVPIPATVWLLGAGLVALIGIQRRKMI
jgi:hypothetical protein